MFDMYKTCPMCSTQNYMAVSVDQFSEYSGGKFIQDAFPELNPMEREFIKTGYCPNCQKLLFGSNYKTKKIRAC